jgi:hypothetical protein
VFRRAEPRSIERCGRLLLEAGANPKDAPAT